MSHASRIVVGGLLAGTLLAACGHDGDEERDATARVGAVSVGSGSAATTPVPAVAPSPAAPQPPTPAVAEVLRRGSGKTAPAPPPKAPGSGSNASAGSGSHATAGSGSNASAGSGSVPQRAKPTSSYELARRVVEGGPAGAAADAELKRRKTSAEAVFVDAAGRSKKPEEHLELLARLGPNGAKWLVSLLRGHPIELAGTALLVARAQAVTIPPAYAPALRGMLSAKTEAVSVAAAQTLLAMHPQREVSLDVLDEICLRRPDAAVAFVQDQGAAGHALALTLIEHGNDATTTLVAPLLLARAPGDHSTPVLVRLLVTAAREATGPIEQELVRRGTESAVALVKAMFGHRARTPRILRLLDVLEALGPEAKPALVELVRLHGHEDPIVRRRVAYLRHSLDPSNDSFDAIYEAFAHELRAGTTFDRAEAVRYGQTLAPWVKSADSLNGLGGLRDPARWEWLCVALSQMGDIGIQALINRYDGASEDHPLIEVGAALDQLGPRVMELLLANVDSRTPSVASTIALASRGVAGVKALLERMRASRDDAHRLAMCEIGFARATAVDEGPLVPAWIEMVVMTDDTGARKAGLRRLMRLQTRDSKAIDAMKRGVKHHEPSVRYATSWGLARAARDGLFVATSEDLSGWASVHAAAELQFRERDPIVEDYMRRSIKSE